MNITNEQVQAPKNIGQPIVTILVGKDGQHIIQSTFAIKVKLNGICEGTKFIPGTNVSLFND